MSTPQKGDPFADRYIAYGNDGAPSQGTMAGARQQGFSLAIPALSGNNGPGLSSNFTVKAAGPEVWNPDVQPPPAPAPRLEVAPKPNNN